MSPVEPHNVDSLVQRARRQDESALTKLIQTHMQRLLESIRAELGERMRCRLESRDVMQQVYLDALRSIDRFVERGDDAFFHWLKSIAINTIRDEYRRQFQTQKRRAEVRAADLGADASLLNELHEACVSMTSPSEAATRVERLRCLQRAMNSLSDPQRKAIELRYFRQLSVSEAAERMGCTQRAVRSLCVRALIRLREQLGDDL